MTRSKRIPRIVASVGCVAAIGIAVMGLPLAELYLGTALFSATLLYALSRPRAVELAAIVVLTIVAAELHLWVWVGAVRLNMGLVGSALGLATYLVLLLRLVWASEQTEQQQALDVLTPSAVLTILLFCTHNMLNLTGLIHSRTFDLYTFSFDGSLGFEPSFWMGKHFEDVHWFGYMGTEAYFAILLALAVAHALHARWRPAKVSRFFMLEMFFAAGFVGYIVYQLFPAAGPAYAFRGLFPQHTLTFEQMKHLYVVPIPLSPNIARNAMPSLHMSWALAIWWNLRNFRWPVAWGAFLFAMITIIATLGTGEHYLIDLVVSFPFTMFFQAVVARHLPFSERVRPMIAGALLTTLWLLLLRYELAMFWKSPVIPWIAIAITVGTSLWMVWPLTSFERVVDNAGIGAVARSASA